MSIASSMPFLMNAVQHADQKTGDIAAVVAGALPTFMRGICPGGSCRGSARRSLSCLAVRNHAAADYGCRGHSLFPRFTERWPDFAALAAADDADVMAAWAGLGYYARARNLIKCAKVVVTDHGGRLPETEAELLKLPGIGPYTAAAIAAIAFDQRAVVVDANVERVVCAAVRDLYAATAGKTNHSRSDRCNHARRRAGDFAQAMMDLGARICSVKSPSCLFCPINGVLRSVSHAGILRDLSDKARKKGQAFTARHRLLDRTRRRGLAGPPRSERDAGGMRALPDDGWNARFDGDRCCALGRQLARFGRSAWIMFLPHFSACRTENCRYGMASARAEPPAKANGGR